jgi:hypothetical protein
VIKSQKLVVAVAIELLAGLGIMWSTLLRARDEITFTFLLDLDSNSCVPILGT